MCRNVFAAEKTDLLSDWKIPHSFPQLKLVNQYETIEVIVLNEGKNEALLYFGGNAEAVIYNAEDFLTAFPLHTVYLLNYRGYGESTGYPTENGIFSDALLLFDKVQEKHQKNLGNWTQPWKRSCSISGIKETSE